jgi:hypothetical protein
MLRTIRESLSRASGHFRCWPEPSMKAEQSASALPPKSNVNLFCYREGVVDLNAEISDRTFDLGVPQKELNGSQIAGSPVD